MSTPGAPLSPDRARAIAGAFAPERGFRQHWDYHYSLAKLRSDPLYPGVCAALRGSRQPLLDLGCGLGLLAHALRADGIALDYCGVDNDAGKIAGAVRAAERQGLQNTSFACIDLAAGDPYRAGRRQPARAHHPRGGRLLAGDRLDERRATYLPGPGRP